MNCLSIDVEGFIEASLQSFPVNNKYIDKGKETYEIEKNVSSLLELLGDLNIKATCFFLGRIAVDIPNIVIKVAESGHEIACHGYEHIRVFTMGKNQFRDGLCSAKDYLEQISGKKVYGFRAPDFSITKSSVWALDIIREAGFLYDSSIYPFGLHDVYGIESANPFIHKLPNGLIEFPLPTIKLFGKRLPFGGGGYFRIFPLLLTKFCVSRVNRLGHPCMFYIHPFEAGPVMPVIQELSWYRKLRHYYPWHATNLMSDCYRNIKGILNFC